MEATVPTYPGGGPGCQRASLLGYWNGSGARRCGVDHREFLWLLRTGAQQADGCP